MKQQNYIITVSPCDESLGFFSLIKVSAGKKEQIGYTTAAELFGKTPEYEKDMDKAEHILLQKKKNRSGDKSLIYMLPIESAQDELIGGFLFQKTLSGETEEIKFVGTVGLTRFSELKQRQISLDESPTVPFEPAEKAEPIAPDTEVAVLFHHYTKPIHQPAVVARHIIAEHIATQQQHIANKNYQNTRM